VPRTLFSRRGPPAGCAFLRALEHALWTEILSCLQLQGRSADSIPTELLLLLPPAPGGGWQVRMPSTPSGVEWLRRWEYPPVRRAVRLSYAMAAFMPGLDRKQLLRASSARERLQMGILHLSNKRRRLAAIAAISGTGGSGLAPPPFDI